MSRSHSGAPEPPGRDVRRMGRCARLQQAVRKVVSACAAEQGACAAAWYNLGMVYAPGPGRAEQCQGLLLRAQPAMGWAAMPPSAAMKRPANSALPGSRAARTRRWPGSQALVIAACSGTGASRKRFLCQPALAMVQIIHGSNAAIQRRLAADQLLPTALCAASDF